jgi:Tfp pilus assembly major pilin PilA
MIVVVIVAIGTALALPSWRTVVEKRHVVAGAERIASFVNFAQSEAIKRNEEVTVSWHSDGGHNSDWCVGVTLGEDDCDCEENTTSESDFCQIDGVARRLGQADFVDMDYDFLHTHNQLRNGSFSFDPVRGLVTNFEDELFDNANPYLFYLHNNMKTGGQRYYELQIRMNITGRIKICAEDRNRKAMIGGYPEC